MNPEPLECENCHQPILVVAPNAPALCPKCRPKRMGRPPKENPRTERITVRLTPDVIEFIDKRRGSWSRPEYVRRALKARATDGLRGPQ